MSTQYFRYLTLAIASIGLASCASPPPQPLSAETELQAALAQSEAYAAAAAVIDEQLMAQPELAQPEPERFNLAVEKMPAKTFFDSLVAGTGFNIVVHPELSGSISLQLNDVSIDEVLAVVRDIYGYEYRRSNNIYTVFPRSLQTQVFNVDYLDVDRRGVSDTSVVVSKITSSSSGDDNGVNNNSAQQRDVDVSGTAVKTSSHRNFWQDLQRSLEAIINSGPKLPGSNNTGRSVMVNAQAGMVVVKALPRELALVRDFLERSQLSVKRQVILETKIIEVQLNDSFSAGINWGEINGQMMLANNVDSIGSNFSIDGLSGSAGEVFSSVVGVGDISKLLSLLQTQGSVQVLSSPRVSTVNNQKAVIRVGSDEFFVTGVSNSTTSNAASTINSPNLELTSFFSGIALDVTPQIAEDGDVILHVHPVVSSVSDQTKNITVGDQQFSLPLALREVRESDSIVRAKHGQVVVLGGLMKENIVDSKGKRPYVGDVPIVNTLFKTKNYRRVKAELVILMKPIVVSDEHWQRQLQSTSERIGEMAGQLRGLN
ncbi:MAG: pilus (MSHA type) biogenesis protein MshL [Cellvibrionaceae bacterium]|nr:pilus (MSHA type) biogenesis protein MshL [Cellvibrionaceae bacterium]